MFVVISTIGADCILSMVLSFCLKSNLKHSGLRPLLLDGFRPLGSLAIALSEDLELGAFDAHSRILFR